MFITEIQVCQQHRKILQEDAILDLYSPTGQLHRNRAMSTISEEIINKIGTSKNIVITGEEGVGKLKKTIEALHDHDNVYYIGNPFDYMGNLRPEGYEKYISDVMSLKKDLFIISNERELLSIDPLSLSEKKPVLVIDEIYGRNTAQYEKITGLLQTGQLKVILITGCMKNIGAIAGLFDLGLMLCSDDSCLIIDKGFLDKICGILKPELH